jgi:HAD superfamily 5'-nucleotidase-like hydrolase
MLGCYLASARNCCFKRGFCVSLSTSSSSSFSSFSSFSSSSSSCFSSFSSSQDKHQQSDLVFSNAEVRLSNIDVIGFDYDFTLVSYTHEVQGLVYDKAKEFLINRLRYPEELMKQQFDSSFCIRGLVFDRKNGNLLKLSSRQMITPGSVFKGRRRLSMSEVLHTYNKSLHLKQHHIKHYCRPLPDMFSLAEGCLISDVVQLAEDLNIPYDPYWLHADVSKAINYAHGEGGMHLAIMKNITKYVHQSPKLRSYLERLQSNNIQTFLLTNSSFNFVNAGMNYLVGKDWLDLFNVSMFEASKPGFFKSKKKFRSLDANNQFVKWGVVSDQEVSKGRALVGGSVGEMMKLTKWNNKQIMYWGDHVFADLAEPFRQSGWHTGAIVRELDHELNVLNSKEYNDLKIEGESIDCDIQKINSIANNKTSDTITNTGGILNIKKDHLNQIDQLEIRRNQNFKLRSTLFNPNFGSVFSSRGQPSSFGWNVRRLSDLYTSKLSNLLNYPDDTRFYPKKLENMPHDVE